MTHPNHRKKGLFLELSRITFEYCKSIGVELIFGFPNNNSFPAFIKHLGFTQLPNLINYNLLENKFEFTRFTSKLSVLSKLHKRYLKFIISIFSVKGYPFSNSNSKSLNNITYILHNETYYRLKKKEDKIFIRIKGVTIWLNLSHNSLSIGDIDLDKPEKLNFILKRLKLIIILSGFRFLTFVSSSNSYLAAYIKQYSKKTSGSYKLIFYNFSSKIPFDKFSFLESDVDVF